MTSLKQLMALSCVTMALFAGTGCMSTGTTTAQSHDDAWCGAHPKQCDNKDWCAKNPNQCANASSN